MAFIELFIYFIVYSFIGYILEVIYVSILNKRIVNRGFLCGPIIPIYGYGAILMILLLRRYTHDYIALFVLGGVIASLLEYITSYVLEKIFHNRWWDYSENKYNLNGRICLTNTLLFGISSVLLIEVIHPFISKYILRLSSSFLLIVFIILAFLLLLDTIYSIIIAYNLRSRLIIVEELKSEKINKIPSILQKRIKKQVGYLRLYPKRLVKAFPYISSKYKEEFDIMGKIRKNAKKAKK